jgi:Flp pilus assembly protein TadG
MCRSLSLPAHIGRRCTPRHNSEQGSTTVEMVILVPVIMLLLLFIVYVGRLTQAKAEVAQAADHAARAAALVAKGRMDGEARRAASESLTDASCLNRQIAVSAGDTEVTATVTCTINRSDLAPLAPGQQVVTATSTEVIDVRRGG